MEQEARGVDAGEVGGAAVGEQSFAVLRGVMQGDVEGVLDVGLVAVGADAGGDGVGSAEEDEHLIDEVRAEVEEHAVGGVSASFQVFSRGMGRKRSKCDSKVTSRPMAPSCSSLRDG